VILHATLHADFIDSALTAVDNPVEEPPMPSPVPRPKPRRSVATKSRVPERKKLDRDGARNPVRALRDRFGVNRKVFSRAVGFSERAIADWEADKPLSDASRQRMQEMSRLHAALATVMKADFIGTWLTTPVEAFDGLKPLEVIERGEIDRLWRMIYQLESGIPD
jgi:DNA-binding transcriptional regulator YiaG